MLLQCSALRQSRPLTVSSLPSRPEKVLNGCAPGRPTPCTSSQGAVLVQVSAAALCRQPFSSASAQQHEALPAQHSASSGASCLPGSGQSKSSASASEKTAGLEGSSSGKAEGPDHSSAQPGQPRPLYNTAALRLWLLRCCQAPRGGLRDKPGKPVDYYHTCYCLSGLSLCQELSGALSTCIMSGQ